MCTRHLVHITHIHTTATRDDKNLVIDLRPATRVNVGAWGSECHSILDEHDVDPDLSVLADIMAENRREAARWCVSDVIDDPRVVNGRCFAPMMGAYSCLDTRDAGESKHADLEAVLEACSEVW